MGRAHSRFVARAEAGQGWRIWDNKARKWWGQAFQDYPERLLGELNGPKRAEMLSELTKQTPRKRA